jgi:KUP system potassium uptake protein
VSSTATSAPASCTPSRKCSAPATCRSPANVYGILSIFFWTLTVIVSIKYVVLVLRADNNGEGGLIAMLALASQAVKDKPRLRKVLLAVGIFGTSLFYGDGVITPAISVLSAVEGLEVVSPPSRTT